VRLVRASIEVRLDAVSPIERPAAIHLRVPVADRERMLWLAEKATELGVTTWQAVRFRRSASVSPRGDGTSFQEKVRARMIGALEQSGGAWLPEIIPDTTPDELVGESGTGLVLSADAPGIVSVLQMTELESPRAILVGPEGGIESDEFSRLVAAGWRPASLARTTLRFETAGIAAIAVVRATQRPEG
jgi:16S rRNA (uracil1498-N3)-methyltransferase